MFISTLELFKIGIGPSSSHTMGPLVAAFRFRQLAEQYMLNHHRVQPPLAIECELRGSLACTGKGHCTDQAVLLGLHGYSAEQLTQTGVHTVLKHLYKEKDLSFFDNRSVSFSFEQSILFKCESPLPEHPNGIIFRLIDHQGKELLSKTWFSIGGGFIKSKEDIQSNPDKPTGSNLKVPYDFDSASSMLKMAEKHGLNIAEMKRANELVHHSEEDLNAGLDNIWNSMQSCIEKGFDFNGVLPGELCLKRRAQHLKNQLRNDHKGTELNEWLCAYALAVSEENAAGHTVVTAPTNGAAGVIPAVLYYFIQEKNGDRKQVYDFLLTAAAVGGLIKHRGSISGAEVGCQGEIGSASAMAAAGLCAIQGGTPEQIENAAEIALEHHLGMTCDPVAGLVQVPCIERNGFGAIKAWAASSLALKGSGQHLISLDQCIATMKETGLDMSEKYRETSLGGLAINFTLC